MTPLKPYPTNIPKTLDGVWNALLQITRLRPQDAAVISNLSNEFVSGRKVNKIPANSTDTTDSQPGDFNVTPTFGYYCVNNGGTAMWVQWPVNSF